MGTMLLMLGGLSAICLDSGHGSWVASAIPCVSTRLLITGALFGATGSLVAVSPIGRRSGAHLNPAITVAFWITGHVHPHDVAGYWAAQVGGAIAGTAVGASLWGDAARSVDFAVTRPGAGVSTAAAVGIEALMTAILVTTVLRFLSSRRLMRWTPLATWVVVTMLVWQGAPYTGTSLNPARSAGPALVAGDFRHLWVYFAGPLLGGAAAAVLSRALPRRQPMTARLFEDERYPTTMGSMLGGGVTPGG
jgi:aquaporin Z